MERRPAMGRSPLAPASVACRHDGTTLEEAWTLQQILFVNPEPSECKHPSILQPHWHAGHKGSSLQLGLAPSPVQQAQASGIRMRGWRAVEPFFPETADRFGCRLPARARSTGRDT